MAHVIWYMSLVSDVSATRYDCAITVYEDEAVNLKKNRRQLCTNSLLSLVPRTINTRFELLIVLKQRRNKTISIRTTM
jgi:hypothetical protein